MNYLKVYCNLIRKAENRTPPEGYTEKHHAFPKSIYGKNNRLVVLTGREHYIAHALLEKAFIKRYGLKDKRTIKMNFAHLSMKGNNRKYLNSYLYENAKKRRSESIRGISINKGNIHSKETKQKMSEMRKGMKWWNNGNIDVRSLECPGEEWISGRLKVQKGRVCAEETKIKIGQKNTGKKRSKETKRKMSEARKGENNHNFGKTHSNETRRKIGEGNKGKTISNETKRKMSESHKGRKNPEHSENMKGKNNPNYCKGSFYEVISPEGEIGYTCILENFCKVNGLDRGAIGRVINYQCRQHNGWIVNKIN
jgi:hypothetical protein